MQEPSLAAVNTDNGTITAVGLDAQSAASESGGAVVIGSPLKYGVVAEIDWALSMFKFFLEKIGKRPFFWRPKGVLFIPQELTPVEHKVYIEMMAISGISGLANALIIEDFFQTTTLSELPPSYKTILEIRPNQP